MALHTWLAFLLASWLISLSPGVGAVAAMSSGLRYGFRRGYVTTFGLILGIMFQLLVVGVGLGAILATSERALAVVKWAGVAYLIYLGVRQWRAPVQPIEAERIDPVFSARSLVWHGFAVNALNPKGTIFLLAVLPQFIDPSRGLLLQYAVIAATLTLTDIVVMAGYTGLAASVLRLLRDPRHLRLLNRTFGGMFVLAGFILASFKRQAAQ